jgi:methionyl-tRNA formyltransferase
MKKEITFVFDKAFPIVFMGSPEFAVPALQKMVENGFQIALVITQPDAPKGRGLQLMPNPVKLKALELNLPLLQPQNVNEVTVLQSIANLHPAIIVTAAYGGYIGKALRKLAPLGCINLHPSLLPKYRGSTPISTCLRDGNILTGNTIYRMNAKMDAGPVLTVAPFPILANTNLSILERDLAYAGADLLCNTLMMLQKGEITAQNQDESKATYTSKLNPEIRVINWQQSALQIHNQIRSLADEPAAVTLFRNKKLKVLASQMTAQHSDQAPGTILKIQKNLGILVATSHYDILLTIVQAEGKKPMSAYAFHLGARIEKGEMLG